MVKKEIEKNMLDLEYKKQLQIQNSALLLGTTSLLPLIISFIWYQERWAFGLALTFTLGLVAYFWYKKADEKLGEISNRLKKL